MDVFVVDEVIVIKVIYIGIKDMFVVRIHSSHALIAHSKQNTKLH